MKVKVQGFQLELTKGISFSQVYHLMESSAGRRFTYHGDDYVYLLDEKENYAVGLILRFSNIKKFITTSRAKDGELIIKVPDLAKQNLDDTEASLFCINPETKRGVFYTYQRSLTKSLLIQIFKENHNNLRRHLIARRSDELCRLDNSRKAHATDKARKEIGPGFKFSVLVTDAALDTILNSYENITRMDINITKAVSDGSPYQPVAPFIKSQKVSTVFDKIIQTSNIDLIKNYIKEKTGHITQDDAVRIWGILENGTEKKLSLGENIEEFEMLEFDRYVELLPAEDEDWNTFMHSAACDNLIKKMKKFDTVFGLPPTDSDWRIPSAKVHNAQILSTGTIDD